MKSSKFDAETGADTNQHCPLCGAVLLTDGTHFWCSNVGSKRMPDSACLFGLTNDVPVETFRDHSLNWRTRRKERKPSGNKPIMQKLGKIGTRTSRIILYEKIYHQLSTGLSQAAVFMNLVESGVKAEDAMTLIRYIVALHFKSDA